MNNLLHQGILYWKNIKYDIELHESDSIEGLTPVTQVQAVLFTDKEHIVLYKHIEGYYGLSGGKPQKGESFEQALRREVREESACEILNCGLIGYMKNIREHDNELPYQLRYWASVQLLDEQISDPCRKAVGRIRGEILIHTAQKKFKEVR